MNQALFEVVSARVRAALEENGVSGSVTPDTVVYGDESSLDSTQLVSLVVDIEEALQERFGAEISLVNEHAMSQSRSPFRNVGALCQYIETLMGEARG